MKKHIFMIAAFLTGLSLTACGPDSVNVNVALSEPAVTTLTEETKQTETTVTATETAAAETVTETAAVTNAASEEPAQTTASVTTAAPAASDCPYAVSDLTGEWVMPGTFGGRNNSMTVKADGAVILRYAAPSKLTARSFCGMQQAAHAPESSGSTKKSIRTALPATGTPFTAMTIPHGSGFPAANCPSAKSLPVMTAKCSLSASAWKMLPLKK